MRKLIHEIHRRSMWQVLGIYLAASWVVLQVVEVVTGTVGLPDWTPGMAFVLLLLGLPICLGTAFVQEGMPGGGRGAGPNPDLEDSGPDSHAAVRSERTLAPAVEFSTIRDARSLLTWRNAILGGIGAFALLGFSLVAYFVLWTTGIGPQGSLVAQGVFEEGDMVVLAHFDDETGSGLGDVTTDAIRVDLQESTVITVAAPAYVNTVLQRMGRSADERLTGTVARELAQREGLKAVITGEVSPVGSGYLLTALLVAAESGDVLRAFRVPVPSEADLLGAIDKLSQDIREKAGESLRSIKEGRPLEEATTPSLEALRLLSQADVLRDRGEPMEAVPLLEQALELDPDFAMAWRNLGVILWNTGTDAERMVEASTRAFELRRRLTDREAALADAWYRFAVQGDYDAAVSAYARLLERHPDDATALNNIAVHLGQLGRWAESLPYVERATELPGPTDSAFRNLIFSLWNTGETEAAWAVLEAQEAHAPEGNAMGDRHWMLAGAGRWEEAYAAGRLEVGLKLNTAAIQVGGRSDMAAYLLGIGRYAEAVALLDDARRVAVERDALDAYLSSGGTLRLSLAALLEEPAARARARESVLAGIGPEDFNLSGNPAGTLGALVLSGAGDMGRAAFDAWAARIPVERRGALYRMLDTELRIFEARARGDAEEARELFTVLQEEITPCGAYCPFWGEMGRIADELGDADAAIELYERHLNATPLYWTHMLTPWTPVALERLGALYAEGGDTVRARARLETLVATYENGDGPFLPYVERARASLGALGR